jgi:hypothetical protein
MNSNEDNHYPKRDKNDSVLYSNQLVEAMPGISIDATRILEYTNLFRLSNSVVAFDHQMINSG